MMKNILLAVAALTSVPAAQAQLPDSAVSVVAHGYFSLSVPDMDASAKWYVEKLGFRVRFRSPHTRTVHAGATLVQSGGLFIELVQQDSAADLSHYLPPAVAAAGGGLDYIHGVFKVGAVVDDVTKTLATLRARGVEITGWQAAKPDQPAAVTFKDNAGNSITLLEEPRTSAPFRPSPPADHPRS